MKTLCDLFIEQFTRHNFNEAQTRYWCDAMQPFFAYLETKHNVTTLESLNREHVNEYIDMLLKKAVPEYKHLYVKEGRNIYVSAAMMFCIQMFIAGLIPEDYSAYPKSKLHVCPVCGR